MKCERGVRNTYGVVTAKSETEAIRLIHVQWIRVQDANIHFPLFEVGSGDKVDTWGKRLLDLRNGVLG